MFVEATVRLNERNILRRRQTPRRKSRIKAGSVTFGETMRKRNAGYGGLQSMAQSFSHERCLYITRFAVVGAA